MTTTQTTATDKQIAYVADLLASYDTDRRIDGKMTHEQGTRIYDTCLSILRGKLVNLSAADASTMIDRLTLTGPAQGPAALMQLCIKVGGVTPTTLRAACGM